MDDNCGEWVECIRVATGFGEQEAGVASGIGWNRWVWLLGVVVRRYIDFLILLIPTPLVSVFFAAASLLYVNVFRSLEERRRMPNSDFFTSRGAYVNCAIISMFYIHSIGYQP